MKKENIKTIQEALQKQGIELKNYGLELVDAYAEVYEYFGNKYYPDASFTNIVVSLNVNKDDKTFWITFFKGAQYKNTEESFVNAFNEKPTIEEPVYEEEFIEDDEEITKIISQIKNIDVDLYELGYLKDLFFYEVVGFKKPIKHINDKDIEFLEEEIKRLKAFLTKQ